MRAVRFVSGVAIVLASIAVVSINAQGAQTLSGTTSLGGVVCPTTSMCLLGGADAATHGAIVPLNETDTHSKDASCQSDSYTVGVAIAAYEVENPAHKPTTPAGWMAALLSHKSVGGPFLTRWPSGNARYYVISVAGTRTGRTTGDHVQTHNGDVIVTAVLFGRLSYDASVHPTGACQNLHVLVPVVGTTVSDASSTSIVGIACPTSTTCFGATQSGGTGGVVTINASSPLHPSITATNPVAQTTALTAIACPTPSQCLAVGTGTGKKGAVVLLTSGVTGTPQTQPHDSFLGVACVSSRLCIAVGSDSSSGTGVILPIVMAPAMTLGSPVTVPSTTDLDAVDCPATTLCFAVGAQGSGSTRRGIVLPFSLSSGTPRPGVVQPVAGTADLGAIDCLGAGACEATGTSLSTGYGVVVGISQGKAGVASIVAGTSVLAGVACLGTTFCVGVGTGGTTGVVAPLPAVIRTVTAVRSSVNPVVLHHVVTYTGIVAPLTSAGTLTFLSNGRPIPGCVALVPVAGIARCATRYSATTVMVIRVSYSGDAFEIGSTSKFIAERSIA